MTLAISTAARAASVPRLIFDPRQRSRACSSVSKLRTALITGNAVLDRDLLQRVRDGMGQILGVAGFPLQDDAESENRIRFFLQREFPHHDWNFKGARHLMQRNDRGRRERFQFLGGVIDEALDVLPVEQARDDREVALPSVGVGSGWGKRGHLSE